MTALDSKPFVSVVICTFGRKNAVKKTIDSVLASSYRNFELIVVDDGSTSGLKEKGFILIKKEHKGLTASRNTGIKNSKGEIIIFVDNDAVVEKNWIKEMVFSFDSPEIGAVSGKTIEYFDKTEENKLWTSNNFGLIKVNPRKLEKNDFIVLHGCNMAFSRNALNAVNFFDENFNYYYDEIDISFRLQKKGFKIKVNPKAVVHHFISGNKRYGNKFEFGKFKYFFALKNFNSGFYFFFLLFNDFLFLLNDIKDSFIQLSKKKINFREFLRDVFFVVAGRISGIKTFLLNKRRI